MNLDYQKLIGREQQLIIFLNQPNLLTTSPLALPITQLPINNHLLLPIKYISTASISLKNDSN